MLADILTRQTGTTIMNVATIGMDVSKYAFHPHAVDAEGRLTCRQRLRRGEIISFFSSISRWLVGMEACASAHHWAREIQRLGHNVRLMPPAYIKPYVRRGAKSTPLMPRQSAKRLLALTCGSFQSRALRTKGSYMVVAIAVANKLARIVWAMMTTGEHYRPKSAV